MLEGQGADELLSGYVTGSFPFLIFELLKRGKFKQAIKEFKIFHKTYSVMFSIKHSIRILNSNFLERMYQNFSGINSVFGSKLSTYSRIKDYPFDTKRFDENFNRELFKAHSGGLVNLLHYGDAISLANSIESRLPFMDVNLVEFSFKLPYNYKMKNGLGKYIHRKAMKNIVPDYILNNPVKFGFSTPLSQHFDKIDTEANEILLSETCLNRGIFNSSGLEKFIKNHIDGKKNNSTILFRLLSVELWYRLFID